jgi:hypothetical protein
MPMLTASEPLIDCLLICSPALLLSPLVFLIREVRKRIVLRITAIAIVFGSYAILLFVVAPALLAGAIMYVADKPPPTREIVLKEDQTLAGIRFPKGSEVVMQQWPTDWNPRTVVLSEDTEINGIPAGKGTTVWFGWDDTKHAYGVGQITTGRAWTYRGVFVPAGSTIFPGTSALVMQDGSRGSFQIRLAAETMVDGIPCRQVTFSLDERTIDYYLSQPLDRDGYNLPAGSVMEVLYEKGFNGEKQGKVVRATLPKGCVLSGVRWPWGITFQRLDGSAETGARIRYEWRSPVRLPVEDMLIQGPSTFEFEGTKLRSVYGHYIWRGQHYKSFQVGVDGQIQREPE